MICLVVLQSLLEKQGFEVLTAINGSQAYQLASQARASTDIMLDLVLLDLSMPIADGYEACRNIIKLYTQAQLQGGFKSDLNLKPCMIAASGFVDENVRAKCLESGFDDVHLMPVCAQTIQEKILPLVLSRRQLIGVA